MSQMPATTALRMPRRQSAARPELRVVPAATVAPPRRLPFALLCSFILAAGLMALLFINMSLAQGTYQLHDLQTRSVQLGHDEQVLAERVAVLQSPSHLSSAAEEIGMVPGTAPVFLDVSDGTTTGVPTPAPTPEPAEEATAAEGAAAETAGEEAAAEGAAATGTDAGTSGEN